MTAFFTGQKLLQNNISVTTRNNPALTSFAIANVMFIVKS